VNLYSDFHRSLCNSEIKKTFSIHECAIEWCCLNWDCWWRDVIESGTVSGMKIGRGDWSTRRKPVTVSLVHHRFLIPLRRNEPGLQQQEANDWLPELWYGLVMLLLCKEFCLLPTCENSHLNHVCDIGSNLHFEACVSSVMDLSLPFFFVVFQHLADVSNQTLCFFTYTAWHPLTSSLAVLGHAHIRGAHCVAWGETFAWDVVWRNVLKWQHLGQGKNEYR
jgi:hypothetical protein